MSSAALINTVRDNRFVMEHDLISHAANPEDLADAAAAFSDRFEQGVIILDDIRLLMNGVNTGQERFQANLRRYAEQTMDAHVLLLSRSMDAVSVLAQRCDTILVFRHHEEPPSVLPGSSRLSARDLRYLNKGEHYTISPNRAERV